MKMKRTSIVVITMLLVGMFTAPFALALDADNNPGETYDPADLDKDGFVGKRDIRVLTSQWGSCKEAVGACVSDLNDDDVVDTQDLLILLAAWNPRPNPDLNGDGLVNGQDIRILGDNWGACKDQCIADLNDDEKVNMKDLLIILRSWHDPGQQDLKPLPHVEPRPVPEPLKDMASDDTTISGSDTARGNTLSDDSAKRKRALHKRLSSQQNNALANTASGM